MSIVATRRRHHLDLIVASLCAIAIVVVVVVVVIAHRAFTIIVDFVARRAATIVCPVAPLPVRIGPHPSTTTSIMVLRWGGRGGFALLNPLPL